MAARKAALRRQAMERRDAAHGRVDPAPALEALRGLILADGGAGVLAGYMPLRSEMDPLPVMKGWVEAGGRVCVPVVVAKGRPLRFREWSPEARMVPGAFGAAIPEAGAELVPDTLIVPLVGFDDHLNRLGYGGGFYDRTLEGLRGRGHVLAIALAYAAQRIPDLPVETTDQPLDHVVTETGLLSSVAVAR